MHVTAFEHYRCATDFISEITVKSKRRFKGARHPTGNNWRQRLGNSLVEDFNFVLNPTRINPVGMEHVGAIESV